MEALLADKSALYELKKLRNEHESEIADHCRCSLCNRAKNDLALIPITKLNLSRSINMFIPIRVKLSYHVQEDVKPIILCDKCHYCYHHFSVLTELALEEWSEDTIFWKETVADN